MVGVTSTNFRVTPQSSKYYYLLLGLIVYRDSFVRITPIWYREGRASGAMYSGSDQAFDGLKLARSYYLGTKPHVLRSCSPKRQG